MAWNVPFFLAANKLGPALLAFGTEEQKKRFLPEIVRGEIRWCQGYSEPNAGSDVVSMKLRADKKGDHYVLNGTKMWITNGNLAHVAIVWAQTDDKIRGFVVPTDTPGFEAREITKKMSTPTKPPENPGRRAWNRMTGRTAIARSPSRRGR